MNERIKELLARPGLERLNDWANIGPVQKAALEEFTELVVLECVRPTDAELERLTGEPHIDGYPLYSGLPPPAKGNS